MVMVCFPVLPFSPDLPLLVTFDDESYSSIWYRQVQLISHQTMCKNSIFRTKLYTTVSAIDRTLSRIVAATETAFEVE